MRLPVLAALAMAVPFAGALAQQSRPPAGKPQGAKPEAAQPQPPAPPAIFACRTQAETCFLGIVIGSQVAVVYTNAEKAEGLEAKPVDVLGTDDAKIDLAQHGGRVVMLAGSYDPKTGIKGEVVEVASPLVSLSIKAQLGGGAPEAPAPAQAGAPKRR